MLTVYLIFCLIAFIFMAIIWSCNTVLNCLFKTFWVLMAISAALFTVMRFLPAEIILQNGMRLY